MAMVESQNPTVPPCGTIISEYGRKFYHIGRNWTWWRAQNPPPLSTMVLAWPIFDNTDQYMFGGVFAS
ncbi:hypothetical protein A2U01_0004910 [Trifolium medium]|uniref:Uncharacterized protein n=1 Tax=Trifolium medium TaxID=97028 RepID=A0A392MA89_9FABA|nr:hypothetical protein [Trifolium medium]